MMADSSHSVRRPAENILDDELTEVCREFSDLCEEISATDKFICRNPTLPHVLLNVSAMQTSVNGVEDNHSSQESLSLQVNDEVFDDESSEDLWNERITGIREGIAKFIPSLCVLHKIDQDYFCYDCNTVLCTECVNEVHFTHDCVSVSVALADLSSQLKKCVQPANECKAVAEISLKRLAQDEEAVDMNKEFCKETISKIFLKVRTAVDEKERLLLEALNHYVDRKLSEVTKQRKVLEEAISQIRDCIEEIHDVFQTTPKEMSVVMNKNEFVEEIDMLAQGVSNIEASLQESKLSSTYAGFHDFSNNFQEKLDEIVAMCEYYPDSDTCYYTSRILTPESFEEDERDTVDPVHTDPMPRSFNSNCSQTSPEDEEVSKAVFSPSPLSLLKRSYSTPIGMTRPLTRKKRGSDATELHLKGPLIPIRYESLRVAATVKEPVKVFDKLNSSRTELVFPCGICMGENNSFIITDVKNHCLRIISSSGKCIGDIGKEGKGLGQFEDPASVVINSKMQLLVCQRENSRIQKLSITGKFVKKFGHKGLRSACLGEPWDLIVSPDGKIYVTDWEKNCIHIFSSSGDHMKTLGGDDSLLGESLKQPSGIDMNSEGQLIVADRGNHCLWLLQTNGHILKRISSRGHAPGELFFPFGVAVHPNGSIIVSESGNNRISVFSSCGKFLNSFGHKGTQPGTFLFPRHICITPKGQLIVADELNHRLQLFDV